METDREIDETVARCVATLVYYHNCGRTAGAREVLEADARQVADWARRAGLSGEATGRLILMPLLAALRDRYDGPYALALYGEFVAALYPRRPSPTTSPGPPPHHLTCRA